MSEEQQQIINDQDTPFKLLSDKPIDNNDEIEFGHDEIAESIFSVIKEAETPFTIGLYGKWGLGKTTIAKAVKKLADQDSFKIFYFDVWKYERDSFRRQFLIELDEELKLDFNFKKNLNQSLSKTDPLKGDVKFDRRLLFNQLGILFLVFLIAGIILYFVNEEKLAIKNLLSNILLTTGLLGAIYSLMFSAIQRTQINISNPRTDSAEGFEDYFKQALIKIKSDYNGKKLLVIIDNLDRTEDKKAIDMLSDIKTFLSCDKKNEDDNNDVVFLIPCDNVAIRDQILSIYGKQFDADEFLRKFFNLTFYIPKLINLDLNRYIKKQLAKTVIPIFQNNTNLEDIIIFTFRDNPREIKQFINSLVSTFLLAKNRKLDDVIKNISFLAKILALRQRFPILYYALEERSLRSTVNFENEGGIEKLYRSELEKNDYSETRRNEEQIKFRNWNEMTKGSNVKNLDVFFSLRQSEEEKKIPEWTSYILTAEEGQEEEAKRIYKDIIEEKKLTEFDELLYDYTVKHKSGAGLLMLTSVTIKISSELNEKLPQFFNISAHYFPMKNELLKFADDFDPEIVFGYWYNNIREKNKKQNLIKQHINILETAGSLGNLDYYNKLISVISKNIKIFAGVKKDIRSYIENNLFQYKHIKNINTKQLQKEFLSNEARKKFVDSIKLKDFEEDGENKEFECLFNYFDDLDLPKDDMQNIVEKYNQLISAADHTNPKRVILIRSLVNLIKKYKNIFDDMDEELKERIEHLSDRLIQVYNESDEELKENLIIIIDYFSLLDTNKVNDLQDQLQNYIRTSSNESISKLPKTKLINWAKKFSDAMVDRCVEDPWFIIDNGIYKHLGSGQHYRIVKQSMDLLESEFVYEYLERIKYNITSKDTIISWIINGLNGFFTREIRLHDMEILKGLQIGDYDNLRDSLFNYLKSGMDKSGAKKTKIRNIVKNYLALFSPDQQEDLRLGSRKK